VHEDLDVAGGEERTARPLRLRCAAEEELVEAAHCGDVVREEQRSRPAVSRSDLELA
jgi:hypothetical protein